jgi:CheY-like chemotaxis protein
VIFTPHDALHHNLVETSGQFATTNTFDATSLFFHATAGLGSRDTTYDAAPSFNPGYSALMATPTKPVILVVEPDFIIAQMLEGILNDLGCDVYGPLASTDQAVAVVIERELDAAFVTLSLGDAHAYRLAELLESRNVPFGFATGYAQDSLDGMWKDRPHVRKPFSTEEIRAFLLKILPLHHP